MSGLEFKTTLPNGAKIEVRETAIERAVGTLFPKQAEQRFRSRVRMAITGAYHGASQSRIGMRSYFPVATDPDSDIIYDLPTLRARSRDIVRNNPIGGGAINTAVTNVVGRGITLQSTIDRTVLNMTDKEADAWEAKTEREFALWADNKDADLSRTLNFFEQQDVVFRQTLENGDVFVLSPYRKRQGNPYGLKTQIIEADRVSNKDNAANSDTLIAGVKKDNDGAPVEYHIADRFSLSRMPRQTVNWAVVPAFSSRLKRRQVLHLFRTLRPGQTRGVPYLAPVIETLKQLSRYTEAELQAAIVAGLFTVFIKTADGEANISNVPTTNSTVDDTKDEIKLAPGGVVGLAEGESVETANPGRPNAGFDPFVQALCRYIGVALEIPKEILMKEFMASYSAARAALLEAWKFFSGRRSWLADNFCQPVYEWWMDEAVAIGRISAPGYFDDPILRQAYLGSKWTGPAKGMIQEKQEVDAAISRMEAGISTLAEETAQLTGGDWPTNHRQSVKERRARETDGLAATVAQENAAPVQQGAPPKPDGDPSDNIDETDNEKQEEDEKKQEQRDAVQREISNTMKQNLAALQTVAEKDIKF